MFDILVQNVADGSTIHTDCWDSYPPAIENINFAYDADYKHEVVNHKYEFVTEEGVHTNNIESQWSALKRQLSPREKGKDVCQKNLDTLLWRKKHADNLWDDFLPLLGHH